MGISGENTGDAGVPPLRRGAFWRRAATAFVRLWALWLVGFLVLTVPPLVEEVRKKPTPDRPAEEPTPRAAPRPDLRRLQLALQAGDDAVLLDFFRTRGLETEERRRVEELISQLGSDRFAERSQASAELEALGPRTLPLLRRAVADPDVERASRSRHLLERLTSSNDVALLAQAIRHLMKAQPEGTVAALLRYLPDAEAQVLGREIRAALVELTPTNRAPEPALAQALADLAPERRAAAALVLGRFAEEQQRSAVRALLRDPDRDVRRQAATVLLARGEKEPIPVLIELLPQLSIEHAWVVIDLLYQVAGTQAPATSPGSDVRGRLLCWTAWRTWWESHGATVNLQGRFVEIPGETAGGPTLVILDEGERSSSLAVFGSGRTHHERRLFAPPVWVQFLQGERFLAVDYRGGEVIELGAPGRGEPWRVSRRWPVFAERQPNGNVFIACRNALCEVTPDGETVFEVSWPIRNIVTGRRLAGGKMAVLTDDGICHWLDRHGHEQSRFATGCSVAVAVGVDLTANG